MCLHVYLFICRMSFNYEIMQFSLAFMKRKKCIYFICSIDKIFLIYSCLYFFKWINSGFSQQNIFKYENMLFYLFSIILIIKNVKIFCLNYECIILAEESYVYNYFRFLKYFYLILELLKVF